MAPKDTNYAGADESDFPSVCETCLGPNPYVRMTKEAFGAACKLCTRPFTLFRWQTTRGTKATRTQICQSCARLKNCCQSCMLDLQFGLPLPIRDAALNMIKEGGPTTDINREYFAQNEANKYTGGDTPYDAGRAESAARQLLKRLASAGPYQRSRDAGDRIDDAEAREILKSVRNMEAEDESSGAEDDDEADGEAEASRAAAGGKAMRSALDLVQSGHARKRKRVVVNSDLTPPADTKICSLFLLGVEEDLPEWAIREFFAEHGAVKSVVCSHRARCAFVNFKTRQGAEAAARACPLAECVIRGCPLKVQWGKPRQLGGPHEATNARMAKLAKQAHSSLRKSSAARAAVADAGDDDDDGPGGPVDADSASAVAAATLPVGSGARSVRYRSQMADDE